MKPITKYILLGIVAFFALVGMIFTFVFIGMQFGLFNVRGSNADRNKFFLDNVTTTVASTTKPAIPKTPCLDLSKKVCTWQATPEWQVIKNGLEKDHDIILRVSKETGAPPRLIASVVIPEQARFFTANREVFKRYFEPLKILGSMTQFSLGISGIKEQTALDIEKYALDEHSRFYPSANMTSLFEYASTTKDKKAELYLRLTDDKNHYYSYLYTALFIGEIQSQWKAEGYDISNRPEIIATIFNLGFNKSNPNPNPEIGGTIIELGGKTYTYGELAANFDNSSELGDIFVK